MLGQRRATTANRRRTGRLSTASAKPLLIERDGSLCTDCGIQLASELVPGTTITLSDPPGGNLAAPGCRFMQVDHVIPRSQGGPDDLSNYQLVCGPCNIARYWARVRS